MCFAPQRRALFQHLNVQKCSEPLSFLHFWLRNVLRPTTGCTFSTSQLQKVLRSWCGLYILASKCAWPHKSLHFFNISTSKSAPKLVWLVHFDLDMCFAPQRHLPFDISTSKSGPRPSVFSTFDLDMCFAPHRRALSWRLNFQKWSEHEVFCTFWLGNVLRATTACNFSSLIWPDVSLPAALGSLLFDPQEPQIIGKHSVSRLSYLFAHLHFLSSHSFSSLIFSLLLFSSLLFPPLLFHLSIWSEVWLLNFLGWYLIYRCLSVFPILKL